MKRISLLLPLFFVCTILGVCSCTKQSNTMSKDLTYSQAERVAYKYVYLTKDGFEFRLSRKEAVNLGIKSTDYDKFVDIIRKGNNLIDTEMNQMKSNDTIDVFFDSNKVVNQGLDSRIKIIDTASKKKSESKLRVIVDDSDLYPTKDDDPEDLANMGKMHFEAVSEDGGPTYERDFYESEAKTIAYGAYTFCFFGFFKASIETITGRYAFLGTGFYPRAGYIPVKSGLSAGERFCMLGICTTGCSATVYAHSLLKEHKSRKLAGVTYLGYNARIDDCPYYGKNRTH